MPRCQLDHIAITAPSLEAGAAYVREMLGVSPQPGGEHVCMGTHNLLLRLGESMYLEVIAINPAAPAPTRPRWFGLDTLAADAAPALSAWVARTGDIRATAAAASEPLGDIEPMSRGALEWLITIPADGSLLLGGVAPALIEWHTDAHPATRLIDHGLSLVGLELHHPEPQRVARLLHSLGFEGPVTVAEKSAVAARRVAHIATPQGVRTL
ncbi:MAG: VOC family protein [Gammaproteobacteria bacterium]|nr:VOC family protein [Gammaproteobacteria bacterium]MBU1416676.1 VOC family protein [Gammaproteobacteria bacterium]